MARLMQKIKDFLHIMAILYGSKVSKFRPRKNWNSEYARIRDDLVIRYPKTGVLCHVLMPI